MDFKEWFESRDDIGCLIGLEGYAAEEAWNARQAEIDALKDKIDAVIDYIKKQERADEYMTGIVDTDGLKELLK